MKARTSAHEKVSVFLFILAAGLLIGCQGSRDDLTVGGPGGSSQTGGGNNPPPPAPPKPLSVDLVYKMTDPTNPNQLLPLTKISISEGEVITFYGIRNDKYQQGANSISGIAYRMKAVEDGSELIGMEYYYGYDQPTDLFPGTLSCSSTQGYCEFTPSQQEIGLAVMNGPAYTWRGLRSRNYALVAYYQDGSVRVRTFKGVAEMQE